MKRFLTSRSPSMTKIVCVSKRRLWLSRYQAAQAHERLHKSSCSPAGQVFDMLKPCVGFDAIKGQDSPVPIRRFFPFSVAGAVL
eukprot:1911107-Pleurochrysis_carterae.AAC.1